MWKSGGKTETRSSPGELKLDIDVKEKIDAFRSRFLEPYWGSHISCAPFQLYSLSDQMHCNLSAVEMKQAVVTNRLADSVVSYNSLVRYALMSLVSS